MGHNANPTLGAGRSGILPVVPRLVALIAVVARRRGRRRAAAATTAPAPAPATATDASASPAPAPRQRLASAPAALRANAADADTLAGEGTGDLNARLATLKGHPVVVNQWASWCGPCRHEFPFFADAVVEHADEVAFLGIDFTDDRDAANAVPAREPARLREHLRPRRATRPARWAAGGSRRRRSSSAATASARYAKLGGYPDAAALEADIRRYAR